MLISNCLMTPGPGRRGDCWLPHCSACGSSLRPSCCWTGVTPTPQRVHSSSHRLHRGHHRGHHRVRADPASRGQLHGLHELRHLPYLAPGDSHLYYSLFIHYSIPRLTLTRHCTVRGETTVPNKPDSHNPELRVTPEIGWVVILYNCCFSSSYFISPIN